MPSWPPILHQKLMQAHIDQHTKYQRKKADRQTETVTE